MFQPVIKWSGSKRSQCQEIIEYFPKEIETYYEPFCGGASVMRAIMESKDILVKRYIISDINSSLIQLWKMIHHNPQLVADYYSELWHELNKNDDKDRKRIYYENVRDRFNEEKSPLDFMFIMRTTTNGMPRYNKNGEFNNSFHITRNGINPDKLRIIIHDWSKLLNSVECEFKVCDYKALMPNKNDFIYMDPPYANTKGMYYGGINPQELFGYMRNLKCKYAFSYDGISGNDDNTYNVPKDVYNTHIYVKSGNSSFKRVIGKDKDAIVYESLYLNY